MLLYFYNKLWATVFKCEWNIFRRCFLYFNYILLAMILCQPHRDSGLVRNRQQCNKWVTIASLTPLPILRVLEVFASSRRKMSVWPTPSKYFKTNLGSLLFGQMGVRQSFFRVDQGLKYGMIWQIYSSTITVYSNSFALNKHSLLFW